MAGSGPADSEAPKSAVPAGTAVAVQQPAGQRAATATAITLAVLLAGAGVTHFARPRPYDSIVPRWLPGPARAWTYASGAAELAAGAAIACPRTRRAGGLAAAALFAAVFPANVQMAIDWRHRPAPQRAAAIGRLPLQAPLIWWALRVRGQASNARLDSTSCATDSVTVRACFRRRQESA
jgi:uncharacterized membrane protein